MIKIVPIVEGDGEVSAVPALLRKILFSISRYDIQVKHALNAHGRDNLKKESGLEKFIKHAWKKPDCGAIFVLIDAEDECPRELAEDFSNRAKAMGIIYPVVIAVAKCMYENWFLASIETIAGQLGLPAELSPLADVESIKNAKRWFNHHFPKDRAYKETDDQVAMTNLLDMELARNRSRSFRRLLHAMEQALEAIDTGEKIVTP